MLLVPLTEEGAAQLPPIMLQPLGEDTDTKLLKTMVGAGPKEIVLPEHTSEPAHT